MSISISSTTKNKKSFSLALDALSAFSKNEDNNLSSTTDSSSSSSTLLAVPLVTVLPIKRVSSSNNFNNILDNKQISITISSNMSSTESSDSEDSDTGSFSSSNINKTTPQPISMKKRRIDDNEIQLDSIQYCIPSEAFTTLKCRFHKCNDISTKNAPFCSKHIGIKTCSFAGCNKCAQGSTKLCISHGGGRRCKVNGCLKGARDRNFCANHGGGKRCQETGCNKSAVGGTDMCTSHGGGKKCSQFPPPHPCHFYCGVF